MKTGHFRVKSRLLKIISCLAAAVMSGVLIAGFFPAPPAYAAKGEEYAIESDSGTKNGVIQCPSTGVSGEMVTITADPDAGCATASLTVLMDGEDHVFEYTEEVPGVTHPDPNTIVFEMPDANVKVFAQFGDRDYQRVFICDMEGGTVETDLDLARMGEIVTLTIKADEGFEYVPGSLKILEVDLERGREQEVPDYAINTVREDAEYSFEMFTSKTVYVRAEFAEVEKPTEAPETAEAPETGEVPETPEATEEVKYRVLVDGSLEFGSISLSQTLLLPGETVTLTVKADTAKGYALRSVTVTDAEGNEVEVKGGEDGRYTFTMPESDVLVTAEFAESYHSITIITEDVDMPKGRTTGCRVDAEEEERAGFTVDPSVIMTEGAVLVELTVKGDISGQEIPCQLKEHKDGSNIYRYSFEMPDEPVTLTARFTISRYEISLAEGYQGTLTVSVGGAAKSLPCEATGGETVKMTFKAPARYVPGALKYSYLRNGEELTFNLPLTYQEDGTCIAEFTMPEGDVTLFSEIIPELNSWTDLQDVIDKAGKEATIVLMTDIRVVGPSKELVIPGGKHITLDLNGFTLDRAITGPMDDGYVFRVETNGTLSIKDSSADGRGKITGGNAKGNGGGIYCRGTLFLYGGSITGNKAKNGGGVYVDEANGRLNQTSNGKFFMRGGSITNNEANDGGGVYMAQGGSFDGTAGLIQGNKARSYGGGMFVEKGDITINGPLQIDGNTADNGGGIARYQFYDVLLIGAKITNNTATTNGGGVFTYNDLGGLYFINCEIAGNSAKKGGGVYLPDNTYSSMAGCTFSDNKASEYGAGLYVGAGYNVPSVDDCIFRGNRCENTGGGIYCLPGVDLNGSTFESNWAENLGGAFFTQKSMEVKNCTFNENSTDYSGGAIGVFGDSGTGVTVHNSTFHKNSSKERGGALWLREGNNAALKNCSFTENTSQMGGAILTDGRGSLTMGKCTFFNNRATDKGGAIYCKNAGLTLILADVDVQENTSVNEGGGVLAENCQISLKGLVKIINNRSEQKAGINNLCLGNTANVGATALYAGSKIKVTINKPGIFATNISKYQLRYFEEEEHRGEIYFVEGSTVSTPIYASVFGEGSWIVILVFGAAAAAILAALIVRKKRAKSDGKVKKKKTDKKQETETEKEAEPETVTETEPTEGDRDRDTETQEGGER